jgi:spore maturation protein SpmA
LARCSAPDAGSARRPPAIGLITLNFAANGLGLDNAATPIGLKAMKALQELNPSPTTASNAQILFLVLNASSLTLLPVTIFMYRAQQGAPDPTLVFLPILLATSARPCRLAVGGGDAAPAPVGPGGAGLPDSRRTAARRLHGAAGDLSATALAGLSSILGNLTLFGLIMLFLVIGALRKVKVYEAFVEGAKEGFDVAKNLLPYLVAMLCAVGVLRASGRWIWPGRHSPSGGLDRPGHALRRCAADRDGQAVLWQRRGRC